MQGRHTVAGRDARDLFAIRARKTRVFGSAVTRALTGAIALGWFVGCSLDITPHPGGSVEGAVQSDPDTVVHSAPTHAAGSQAIAPEPKPEPIAGAGGAAVSSNNVAGVAPTKATAGAPAAGSAGSAGQTAPPVASNAGAGAGGSSGAAAPDPTDDDHGHPCKPRDSGDCDESNMGAGTGPGPAPKPDDPAHGMGPRADAGGVNGLIGALVDVSASLPPALISEVGSLAEILLGLSTQLDLTPDVVGGALSLLASANVCSDDQGQDDPCGAVCDFVGQNCDLCHDGDCAQALHQVCGDASCH